MQAEPRERVLEATYTCVARFGMGKTTVEDVVKESGVSRASIYRLFPGGKDQLLRETVGWEMNRFLRPRPRSTSACSPWTNSKLRPSWASF